MKKTLLIVSFAIGLAAPLSFANTDTAKTVIVPTKLDEIDEGTYCVYKNEIYTRGALVEVGSNIIACAPKQSSGKVINGQYALGWVKQ
ncbi:MULTISPECIES: DUF1496 domain-containing protein [unclassified Shewanella]|uniref:DUF1496 domain-containing protein n=1 Tax=unclassified Shewanella TaxID=196818 RepID=UPI0021D7D733|nr:MULTISPECIES: DUF1496 domain-containing protein [unclassified Shewanella]MCU8035714.1 DUF1496 domain-containing protein [Shewanella sp. SM71]MCU8097592.1 DUF1496 domain-containing protein [Shewanella sp. SM102]